MSGKIDCQYVNFRKLEFVYALNKVTLNKIDVNFFKEFLIYLKDHVNLCLLP